MSSVCSWIIFNTCFQPRKDSRSERTRKLNGRVQLCLGRQPTAKSRSGSGGVTIAVKEIWTDRSSVTQETFANHSFMRSHAVGITVQPPHCYEVHIWGVYMPFEPSHRQQIYKYLQETSEGIPFTVLMGDWNAALFPSDRPSGMLAFDSQHAAVVDRLQLCAMNHAEATTLQGRQKSYIASQEGGHNSRIGDVLLSKDLQPNDNEVITALDSSDDSDHVPLRADICISSKRFIPPPPLSLRKQESRLKPLQNLLSWQISRQI